MSKKTNPAKLNQPDFSSLAENWPSPFISREEVQKFTGGIVNRRTLANLDSLGMGPEGRIRVGRKVAYPVAQFIEWLERRAEVIT